MSVIIGWGLGKSGCDSLVCGGGADLTEEVGTEIGELCMTIVAMSGIRIWIGLDLVEFLYVLYG